ncbi:MAG TPA: TonB-dependent receptor plug domain-containing protein, partial [Chitinophagaceae bacterium]|nr:TonB-dependent receptor plug domain-containing protein [Chitinophagaceae bacterium]
MKKLLLLPLLFQSINSLRAQEPADSARSKHLQEVIIRAWTRKDIGRISDETNGYLYSGKKNELINLAGTNANIAIKTGRQLFSKVPGVFVYDMDGSGNQLNIATRGLDPHRSWEFNVRQNGVIINSDMYGYPASHYSAPMESFERIEVLRGTGALQYGAQFGGMINYVTKKPDSTRHFAFESVNTAGSFGLLSTYNAVGGTIKKFSYYAYYYKRHSMGYRKNSESDADAQFVHLQYRFSSRLNITAELGRSKYLYRIPGPLNDSMFHADPRMSTRNRNYFSPDIYVPSLSLQWLVSERTKLHVTASGVFGNRSSVQFDAFANITDTNSNRQVDIDGFHSRTIEARLIHEYVTGGTKHKLGAGVVYMNNDLHRRQLGKGSTGDDYDLSLVEPGFGRDIHFRSVNTGMYIENALQINKRWTVSPGLRWEHGRSGMSGTIRYYSGEQLPTTI